MDGIHGGNQVYTLLNHSASFCAYSITLYGIIFLLLLLVLHGLCTVCVHVLTCMLKDSKAKGLGLIVLLVAFLAEL